MAKKTLKVDPVTEAKNAVRMFEEMQGALDFLNGSVKDMIQFNLDHAKKRLKKLEDAENALLDENEVVSNY